ncbi:hypothetical protein CBF34_01145 [Vagococcus penaei]|uniref:Uncharacterized protein n=1 Tax=Vagococcus penaei TaxID=633807 RepID=A0A1Q2D8A6_9ENTE|nr:flagellar FlbD family protein [Vagococcus penaei]AQP54570.1 hypothetical protein BW732_10395 [Vagococcus penaei]RSU06719.1 hypothetical protein CBF34_01145 [Vagococcus penaei]
MIELTMLNNTKFYLNCSLLARIEASPDTIITLVDGTTLMVKESPEKVANLFLVYHQQVHRERFDIG